MTTYGDRVQFGLNGTGSRPHYQVINTAGKKMAFDSKNHLLHPEEGEFVGSNATGVYTLDQIKMAIAGGLKSSSGTGAVRSSSSSSSGRGKTAAARALDQFAAERYEYFKNNRQSLPPSIVEYTDEITELMKKGMTAEAAFGDVIKRYF